MRLMRLEGASRNAALLCFMTFALSGGAVAGPQLLAPTTMKVKPQSASVTQEAADPFTVFTPQDMKAFVAAAAKADALKDPMKRCLDFPDPPGSHWSREGITAYCRYIQQPTISLEEFDRLISGGHARELDQRLASWEADPKMHPAAFRKFLMENFRFGDAARQVLIESWKQQSPDSAYAYALSGWNYENLGWAARGDARGADTPQAKMDAMDKLMERARGDFDKAVRLNPRLSAAYAGMISLGTPIGDHDYVAQAVKQGLQAKADKFPIVIQLATYTATRWYGTPAARQWLLSQVEQSIAQEPLLHVVRPLMSAYEAEIDHKDPVGGDWTVYRRVFDDVATTSLLKEAGLAALRHRQYSVAYVYLSESERSDTSDQEVTDGRAQALSFVDQGAADH
ncbi:DUF4034 domain-containing protein [Dyella telluris]|uniref:DUF4034 domain-containing protein n=1 Tax=Dyella telluris TaxID=2763498 RepID=A0A7G8Q6N6_9GAMM|nr:DUF4034 domain-containing protein [Dyella telluris]QNK02444.1 DUF4034 domain-containing protein [Dyella telluris]